jgi:hypothetical protein
LVSVDDWKKNNICDTRNTTVCVVFTGTLNYTSVNQEYESLRRNRSCFRRSILRQPCQDIRIHPRRKKPPRVCMCVCTRVSNKLKTTVTVRYLNPVFNYADYPVPAEGVSTQGNPYIMYIYIIYYIIHMCDEFY